MIEIILREDVSGYETKPLFGFTYRQMAAIALSALACFGVYNFCNWMGFPLEIIVFLIFICGAVIGTGFLVKIQGMYGNKRLPILIKYKKMPKTIFCQNAVFKEAEIKQEKKDKRELKTVARDKAMARNEAEFLDERLYKKQLKMMNKKKKRNKQE